MSNRKIENFIKKTPEGEAIAMALIFFLGVVDKNKKFHRGSQYMHDLKNNDEAKNQI